MKVHKNGEPLTTPTGHHAGETAALIFAWIFWILALVPVPVIFDGLQYGFEHDGLSNIIISGVFILCGIVSYACSVLCKICMLEEKRWLTQIADRNWVREQQTKPT